MDYGFVHQDRVYTPNGTAGVSAAENDARNAAIEQAELAHWTGRPDRQLAYFKFPANGRHKFAPMAGFPYVCAVCGVNRGLSPELCDQPRSWRDSFTPARHGATVSTWLGTVIGTITSARVYRHNFGGRFVSLQVKGTNGATYHGRASWDNGECVQLRRGK